VWTFFTALIPLVLKAISGGKGHILILGCLIGVSAFAGWKGKTYVDEKHKSGLQAITKNKTKINSLRDNQKDIANSLKTMSIIMNEVKTTIRRVDTTNQDMQKRVIDIYKNVYQIKKRQTGS